MIRVGRPINGITINGLEFLVDDAGNEINFKDKEEAQKFLLDAGVAVENVEAFTYQEEVNGEWETI